MTYPTLEEVNAASHERICSWVRFLPSPGSSAIGKGDYEAFRKRMEAEKVIMDRICQRLAHLGGFTPQISKAIGWGD